MIENVERLVNELRAYKSEEDWFEFKIDNSNPETIAHNHLTNASVRARFGLDNSQKVKASRLIGGLLEKNLIKPFDPEAAPKLMSYIPYWA